VLGAGGGGGSCTASASVFVLGCVEVRQCVLIIVTSGN
jgi:hypothetical protein